MTFCDILYAKQVSWVSNAILDPTPVVDLTPVQEPNPEGEPIPAKIRIRNTSKHYHKKKFLSYLPKHQPALTREICGDMEGGMYCLPHFHTKW